MKPRHRFALLTLALATLLALILGSLRRQPPTQPNSIPEARRDTLTLHEGRLCRLGETTPFSGLMLEFYPDGTLQSRSSLSNGLLHGLSEGWHTNGQLQVSERFHASISHGLRTKWYPNGQKLSEATVSTGQIEGVFRRWHEDGSLAQEVTMKAGQPDGLARSYFASGFVQAEARLQDGQLIEQQFWNDHEHQRPPLAQNRHAPSADDLP
ncbi:MAG: toxin-antitoxin system YwqK family antitoxin [Verrucomicrobia bacterium]|nr:toxin-antitoxin system YwqK family antitoxin [Verrucomicrobiota bacterium]